MGNAMGPSFDLLLHNSFDLPSKHLRITKTCTKQIFKGKNLFEGIRAVIVDKTRDANWEEPTIEDVSDENVKKYFANSF